MKKTFFLRVKKRAYFSYCIFKHVLSSQLSNLFSKQYLSLYLFLIFSICISYICSLLSLMLSIFISLILPLKTDSLMIISIIVSGLFLTITIHTFLLIMLHSTKNKILSIHTIIDISKNFFTNVLLYFTLLLQFTDVLSFDNINLLTELEDRKSWLLKCTALGINALSLQIIYFFKYQLNDITQTKSPYNK